MLHFPSSIFLSPIFLSIFLLAIFLSVLIMRTSLFFIVCCVIAAVVPLAPIRSGVTDEASTFPGWPAQFEGRSLTRLPLSSREERFAADFPGRVARFSDGRREIIVRWVSRETRALHPASDCFKGLGYSIRPLPVRLDQSGRRWGSFEARRDAETLIVRERIYDSVDYQSWSDVSSWYWHAITGKTNGGWWRIVTDRGRAARDRAARDRAAMIIFPQPLSYINQKTHLLFNRDSYSPMAE